MVSTNRVCCVLHAVGAILSLYLFYAWLWRPQEPLLCPVETRPLVGEVTDRLVGVTATTDGKCVHIRAYFSGKVTSADVEQVSFIGGEVIADFPEQYKIEESTLSADDGELEMLDFWAFLRKRS
jgi:hypothetical protein